MCTINGMTFRAPPCIYIYIYIYKIYNKYYLNITSFKFIIIFLSSPYVSHITASLFFIIIHTALYKCYVT